MKAELLQRDRFDFDDGTFLVGYDNERSKGDHRHAEGHEEPYKFKDVETLARDFFADVEQWRSR
jgi:hypothetical protein